MTFGGHIVYLWHEWQMMLRGTQINNMHDKSHVIIIIITILNNKLEISKITVKKIRSNLQWAESLSLSACGQHVFNRAVCTFSLV